MLEIFISSIGSASLVGAAFWLCRTWIKERLTASIHLETEQKLAKLKSELDSANQRIHALSAVAASANQQVESALLEHRIAAVKTAWEKVQNWQQVSVVTMMIAALSDEWIKKNASDPNTKSTFDKLLNDIDRTNFLKNQNEAFLVRPFLSEPAWALYFAYHSFLSTRFSKALILTISGLEHAAIISRIDERNLVAKTATPEILAAYDKCVYAATEPYLHYLQEKMLIEFSQMLSGHHAGNQALSNAAEILRVAEELSAQLSKNLASMPQT